MKAKVIYTAILLVALLNLNIKAQQPTKEKINVLIKNCYNSLTHENQGVAESAIFVILQFKNKFPYENTAQFVEALEEIAIDSENARMSYKAQLAKIYFNNHDWFSNVEIKSIENEQKVFEEIAGIISSKMFAADF